MTGEGNQATPERGSGNGSGPGHGNGRGPRTWLGVPLAAIVVGALAGLLAVGFRLLVDEAQFRATGSRASILEIGRTLPFWARLALPTGGALVGALLLYWLGRGETAFGVRDLMEVVTLRRKSIQLRPTLGRIVSALATIATGGSVGREGPILQLGATAADLVGRAARAGPRSHSILLAAGAAAGIASAYNAPLAGCVFVMEIVLSNFALDVFVPVAFASATAFLVKRIWFGPDPVYDVAPERVALSGTMILGALLVGMACGPLGVAFQRLLQKATALFAKLPVHPIARPVIGGLLVGAIGLVLPEVWGNGQQAVHELVHWKMAWWMCGVLLVMKPVATACSIGSGGQGGIFTPSMFTGAAFGALLAAALQRIPGLAPTREGLAFVGMAGVIAGITHAPLTATLLLFELTNRSELIVPLALGAAAAALTARLVARDSFYIESLRARGVPVDAGIEELTLHQTRVGDLLRTDVPTVATRTPLDDIVARFRDERVDLIHVVDEGGRFKGVIALHDVKSHFNDASGVGRVVLASELARRVPTLHRDQSLAEVLELFDDPDLDELPVVDGAEDRLVGRLARRDLIATLNVEVLGRPSLRAKIAVEGEERARWLELPRGYELARIPVTKELAGRRLGDTGLRRNHRLVVLAIVRPDPEFGEQRIAFEPDFVLAEGEQVVVMGRAEDIAAVRHHGAR